MTEELVATWAEMHGLNKQNAAREIKYFTDLYLSNKKASAPTETSKTLTSSIEEIPW